MHPHEIVEAGQVTGIAGPQCGVVDDCGGGDQQVGHAGARLAPSGDDGSSKATIFARDNLIDGQRIERALDDGKPPQPFCSCGVGASDQYAEMQLGQRHCADRYVAVNWSGIWS